MKSIRNYHGANYNPRPPSPMPQTFEEECARREERMWRKEENKKGGRPLTHEERLKVMLRNIQTDLSEKLNHINRFFVSESQKRRSRYHIKSKAAKSKEKRAKKRHQHDKIEENFYDQDGVDDFEVGSRQY